MKVHVCQHEGGSGCPDADGGPHYYAHIDPEQVGRICIDCGAPEARND